MGSSKYQKKAQENLHKNNLGKRPKYYDEDNLEKKQNFPYIFIIGILIVGFGLFGVGKLINNAAQNNTTIGDSNENPYYNINDAGIVDESGSTDYKTPLIITDIDGTQISLADHAGKVIVLYFHFLDCGACQAHSPNLASAMESFNSNQLLVISISVVPQDTSAALKAWKSDNAYEWYLVRDTNYALSSRFGAQYTPHMVYLAPDGDSSTQYTGMQSVDQISNTITSLL